MRFVLYGSHRVHPPAGAAQRPYALASRPAAHGAQGPAAEPDSDDGWSEWEVPAEPILLRSAPTDLTGLGQPSAVRPGRTLVRLALADGVVIALE